MNAILSAILSAVAEKNPVKQNPDAPVTVSATRVVGLTVTGVWAAAVAADTSLLLQWPVAALGAAIVLAGVLSSSLGRIEPQEASRARLARPTEERGLGPSPGYARPTGFATDGETAIHEEDER